MDASNIILIAIRSIVDNEEEDGVIGVADTPTGLCRRRIRSILFNEEGDGVIVVADSSTGLCRRRILSMFHDEDCEVGVEDMILIGNGFCRRIFID